MASNYKLLDELLHIAISVAALIRLYKWMTKDLMTRTASHRLHETTDSKLTPQRQSTKRGVTWYHSSCLLAAVSRALPFVKAMSRGCPFLPCLGSGLSQAGEVWLTEAAKACRDEHGYFEYYEKWILADFGLDMNCHSTTRPACYVMSILGRPNSVVGQVMLPLQHTRWLESLYTEFGGN